LGGTSESDHWRRENHQRNALARGLTGADGDDFILLSDLDEIPKAEAVKKAANTVSDWATIHAFEMRMFWYFLNLEHPEKWVNSRMTKRRYIPTLQTLRIYNYPWKDPRGLLKRWSKMFRTWHRPIRWEVHRNSGWHFTFMNGADAVRAKLLSYAHVSSESFAGHESVTERIALALASSLRPDDPYSYKLRKIDKNFPSYLRANLDKFRHLIADDSILSL
jgi:beta-1,4-mannosyl-glycoprotein beta-1,4-N-acetylglucosaminyltransferase